MPNCFGRDAQTVDDMVALFRAHGEEVRFTYRARYRWGCREAVGYSNVELERPDALRDNPPGAYPWEQIFVAAASCAGSDYPMLAHHLGVPLDDLEFVVEGVFDPRGEFHGLAGFDAPADSAHCFLSLHLKATVTSPAPRNVLEKIHARVVDRNMVLGALRGIPRTSELVVRESSSS